MAPSGCVRAMCCWRSASTETRRSDLVGAPRTAAARYRPFADDRVVVRQLLASANRPRRLDPDRLVDDLEVAVGRARVVDEPRHVAADVGIPAPRAVHAEDPGAAFREIPRLARLALPVVANQLAGVVDDARVLRDGLAGEDAEAVYRRAPAGYLREAGRARHTTIVPDPIDAACAYGAGTRTCRCSLRIRSNPTARSFVR